MQFSHVGEQVGVRAQRRQPLEKQRKIPALAQHRRRECFDGTMAIQQLRSADRADSGNARIAIRRVTDQREVVGNQRGFDTELLADPSRVADLFWPCGQLARRDLQRRTERDPCRASRY